MDDVRVRLLPDVVAEQAEMFLINGDMQSNLYTSSRAMHSAILGLLQVQPLSLAVPSAGQKLGHSFAADLARLPSAPHQGFQGLLSKASHDKAVVM